MLAEEQEEQGNQVSNLEEMGLGITQIIEMKELLDLVVIIKDQVQIGSMEEETAPLRLRAILEEIQILEEMETAIKTQNQMTTLQACLVMELGNQDQKVIDN